MLLRMLVFCLVLLWTDRCVQAMGQRSGSMAAKLPSGWNISGETTMVFVGDQRRASANGLQARSGGQRNTECNLHGGGL